MQPVRYCFEIMTSANSEQEPREPLRKFARVFIARSGFRAIVVGMHTNEHDIWSEDDSPTVLNKPFTAEELGNAIAEAMGRTDRINGKNLREGKLTDWPAYKASGERTVRKFDESFIEISVEGANPANLIAVITGIPQKDANLQVTSTISTGVVPAELGDRVLEVYKSCLDRRV
jgi:hypothetical protein